MSKRFIGKKGKGRNNPKYLDCFVHLDHCAVLLKNKKSPEKSLRILNNSIASKLVLTNNYFVIY